MATAWKRGRDLATFTCPVQALRSPFANEDPGWHVGFDGSISRVNTDEFVAQVARQVQQNTGTSTEWVRVT